MENISVKENRSVTEILEMHQKWLVGNGGKRLRWYELSTEEKQMMEGANLRSADLEGANLEGAKGLYINCPEVGSFIAFKKLSDNLIAKLEIPEHAKRSSSTGRKCRASTAKVLEIFNIYNYEKKYEIGYSEHRADFKYEVGKFVFPDSFDEDRFNECSSGIHFFITLQEAIDY